MSAQPVTTLETIEHLDFKAETPCEHSTHRGLSHKADVLVRETACPSCGQGRVIVAGICLELWRYAGIHGVACPFGRHTLPRDELWTIVEVLS